MNWSFKRSAVWLLMLALMMVGANSVLAQSSGAQVRFVHVIPGAAAVDVYTDGQLTISGLTFGSASTYVQVAAGDHQITVSPAGATNALWQQTISPAAGTAVTLIAASASTPNFITYVDNLSPIPLGKARLTAIHAISGGPTVDLLLSDGRPVIPALEFGQPAGTLDVPTFTYDFVVAPTGQSADQALVTLPPLSAESGTSYTAIVYGTVDQPEVLVLTSATQAEVASGFVRFMHGSSDSPAVDIYINDTLAIPSLEFAEYTAHIAIPTGTYNVAVRAAGSQANLLAASVPVEADTAITVAVLGSSDELSANVFSDNIAGIDGTAARLGFINGIVGSEAVTAELSNGIPLTVSPLAFGESGSTSTKPGVFTLTVDTDGTPLEIQDTEFYGGVYYNLLAVEDGGALRVITAATSLAQGIGSAPGGSAAQIAIDPTVAAPEPTLPPPPEPTLEPTAVVAVEPTVAPVQPTAAPPTVVPATGPTARVFNLNADANLQLRQYPGSDALSLGTVPPNTILLVNGREGAIEEIPFSATPRPPEDYEFIDPVTLFTTANEDLVPQDTWLNVTYNTPDGGSITAWANALYLDVRNPRGERVKLADLPLVASNLPGEVTNSAVTPPPVPANRVAATVFNLDEGINLNIRRTADNQGEVLARVPNGTVMEFLGISEAQDWVFVRYSLPEGGNVEGWVNSLYVQYSYNNRPIDLDEIDERGLLVITPNDTRGTVTAGVSPAAIPTTNPTRNAYVAEIILDLGANLNLRRQPDTNAEVLAQIPGGAQVIVSSRSEDGNWLQVTFEGTEGWIASRTATANFVSISFNGRPAQISDVPVTGEPILPPSGSVEATPTSQFISVPSISNEFIAMTGSPGGDQGSLPFLNIGQEVTLLFTDGTFSYIELPDGTRGWVPAGAVRPR